MRTLPNPEKASLQGRLRVKSGQLKSAWSTDGIILVKSTNDDGNDVVQRINSVSDLPVYRALPSAAAAGGGGATD